MAELQSPVRRCASLAPRERAVLTFACGPGQLGEAKLPCRDGVVNWVVADGHDVPLQECPQPGMTVRQKLEAIKALNMVPEPSLHFHDKLEVYCENKLDRPVTATAEAYLYDKAWVEKVQAQWRRERDGRIEADSPVDFTVTYRSAHDDFTITCSLCGKSWHRRTTTQGPYKTHLRRCPERGGRPYGSNG